MLEDIRSEHFRYAAEVWLRVCNNPSVCFVMRLRRPCECVVGISCDRECHTYISHYAVTGEDGPPPAQQAEAARNHRCSADWGCSRLLRAGDTLHCEAAAVGIGACCLCRRVCCVKSLYQYKQQENDSRNGNEHKASTQ